MEATPKEGVPGRRSSGRVAVTVDSPEGSVGSSTTRLESWLVGRERFLRRVAAGEERIARTKGRKRRMNKAGEEEEKEDS